MDTVKGSWVMAVDRNTSAGLEGVYKVGYKLNPVVTHSASRHLVSTLEHEM
jgi:hypothetical protein